MPPGGEAFAAVKAPDVGQAEAIESNMMMFEPKQIDRYELLADCLIVAIGLPTDDLIGSAGTRAWSLSGPSRAPCRRLLFDALHQINCPDLLAVRPYRIV